MPRKTRMYLPDVPIHIVQRGNNRDACFFSPEDYLYYKQLLVEGMRRYGAQLHAYCLMTNHVHLLMTPKEEDSVPRVIQHLGRQYVQYINKTYRRSGTLWEGRYKGSLVDAENYLLHCYRYIELNPVVANMVNVPEEYPWSSYHANGLGKNDPLVTFHSLYMKLGLGLHERQQYYRDLFRYSLSTHDVHDIRECLDANQPLGCERFKDQIESALGRKLGYKKRGRPVKQEVGIV